MEQSASSQQNMITDFNGQQLRRWRRKQDIKQDCLADMLGVTQASVSRWERGQQQPAPHVLRILYSLMQGETRQASLDRALKRLVRTSQVCVHIVEDRSHRLLVTSGARLNEWQRQEADLLGTSLWRFATEEIAAAEAALQKLGWWDDEIDCLAFPIRGRIGPPLRVAPQHVLWERIRLSDGSHVRLTTSIDEAAFAQLPAETRNFF